MFWRALVLLLVGAIVGLGGEALGPAHYVPWKFAAAATESCEGGATVAEISAAEARALCGAAGVVIADARTPARFAEGHIAGAAHLPCSSEAARAAALDHADKILVYGDTTAEAAAVAQSLAERTHAAVFILTGGFAAWTAAGNACASGACGACDHPAEEHAGQSR